MTSLRFRGYDPYIVVLAGIAIALLVALGTAMPSRFLDVDTFTSMGVQAAELGMFGVAMTLALLIGGIDLSIVAVANLAAILAGLTIQRIAPETDAAGSAWLGLAAGTLVALSTGVVAGLLNGVLIAVIGMPSILATLGSMTLVAGLSFGITGGSAISGLPEQLVDTANAVLWGVPASFALFILVWGLSGLMLRRTSFGESLILIGTSPRVARFSGIPVYRITIGTYAITGLIGALTGLISLLRTNSAHADYGGTYVLLSILIAVLGGVSVFGGAGRLIGVLWAVVILQLLSTGFNMLLLHVSDGTFFRDFVWGLLLLAVMTITTRLKAGR